MRWLITCLLVSNLLAAGGLNDRIASITAKSRVAQRGFWGAKLVELETGETLYEHNAGKLFEPASNTKLFSTSMALMRLGPEYRFRTLILGATEPDEAGIVHGDLVFYGGGDPTLSARKFPYVDGPTRGDPLAPLGKLADAVVARGVKRIEGDVVGDDSAFVWEPYPDGWARDDADWDYGAPVSALTLHDNAFRISALPAGKIGDPARLFLKPPSDYYVIRNHVETVARGEVRVSVEWPMGSREIHLWGTVKPRAGQAKLLAIREPPRYAAWVLARALRDRGVVIDGSIRARHRHPYEMDSLLRTEHPPAPEGEVIAERNSPPLFQILQVINKESQNLHAELVMREVARRRRNVGSVEAGLAELSDFLAEAGISAAEYHFEDASGLSSMNLVTPSAAVQLLSYMYLSKERDGWLELLAVGGEDGTLDYRFKSPATRGRVIAKTGTLTGASALSGYLDRKDGRMLAFSVFVNNYNTRTAPARELIDRIVTAFLAGD